MNSQNIVLSDLTKAFLASLTQKSKPAMTLEGEQFEVSQTVSFFGFLYERLRNAVEFNEEHLIRRMAIARILRRRLSINPQGKGEGENLVRELLWGRYVEPRSSSRHDIQQIQKIIDSYLFFLHHLKENKIKGLNSAKIGRMVIDFLSCEIEENLSIDLAHSRESQLYYFYQSLKSRISVPGLTEEKKDLFFYAAAEEAYLKNDRPYINYHIFTLHYGPLYLLSPEQVQQVAKNFTSHLAIAKEAMNNPQRGTLIKFAQKQAAPYRILFSVIEESQSAESLLTDSTALKAAVDRVCTQKYTETGIRLRSAAIKSVIYIFLTKMIFVLLLEVPSSRFVFGKLHLVPLSINTVFPPILMGIIVTFISPPSQKNTERTFNKIVEIINSDPNDNGEVTVLSARNRLRQPSLLFMFTVIYFAIFAMTFGLIYIFLDWLDFNIINKLVFMFFISVIAFFGYRIRQTAKEYVLETSSNVLISLLTFLFLPILYVGKWLSSQISKINLFILLFDYLIEAPFKFFIEVAEEWIRFIKARKDELI